MKNEVFAVSAYNVITWHDDRLEWDPQVTRIEIVQFLIQLILGGPKSIFLKDYDGVTETRVFHDMVWHPNVVLYNTLDESLGDSDDANVKIRKLIIHYSKHSSVHSYKVANMSITDQ